MPDTDESKSQIKELALEYAEIGADKLVEESKQYIPLLSDLGEEIPYVKTLIAAIKAPRTLSDFLLGRKVFAFLYSSNIDASKLDKFKRKFSKTKQERLWEQVVFSINAHDNKIKSEIIGKIFAALVDEFLSEDEFFSLVHATNSLNMQNLDDLKSMYMLEFVVSPTVSQMYSFATLGLIEIDNNGIGTIGGGGPQYPLNQLGWKYVGIIYDFPDSGLPGYKLGEDQLVQEINEDSNLTGKSYPLSYIQQNGLHYREVDIFMVNNGSLLCSNSSDLPVPILQGVPSAGTSPQKLAQILCEEFENKPIALLLRKMEDVPVQKWAFAVSGNLQPKETSYRTISQILSLINETMPKTDEHRYLIKVLEELERHLTGDLKSQGSFSE